MSKLLPDCSLEIWGQCSLFLDELREFQYLFYDKLKSLTSLQDLINTLSPAQFCLVIKTHHRHQKPHVLLVRLEAGADVMEKSLVLTQKYRVNI